MQLISLPAYTKYDMRNVGRCTVFIHIYCRVFVRHGSYFEKFFHMFVFACISSIVQKHANTKKWNTCRAHSEPGGTRWRTGGEVKGKQANGVGSQYNSTLPRNVVCPALLPLLLLIRTPRLPVVDWTDAPTNLNGLVRFAERRNLVSARVPSRSARAILRPIGTRHWLV